MIQPLKVYVADYLGVVVAAIVRIVGNSSLTAVNARSSIPRIIICVRCELDLTNRVAVHESC